MRRSAAFRAKAGWCVLVLLALGAGAVTAETLVMRDGSQVETKGPFEVKGRRVLFTNKGGQLMALRLDEVDLDATRRLAEAPPATEPEAAAAAVKKPVVPVLTLTNKDIEGPKPRRLVLPGNGVLTFEAPAIWQYEYQQPASGPSILMFSSQNDPFKLRILVLTDPGTPDFNGVDRLRRMTEEAISAARITSAGGTGLEAFEGAPGYWFWVQDRVAEDADGYIYRTQGHVAVGDLILAFTLLTPVEPQGKVGPIFSFLRRVRHLSS